MIVPLVRCTELPMFEGHRVGHDRVTGGQVELSVLHRRVWARSRKGRQVLLRAPVVLPIT
jgi:hypothetical protein